MKHMINVGNSNKFDKTAYEGLSAGIVTIFEAAEKFHMDEVTTREALKSLTDLASVRNVSISNSNFQNGTSPEPKEPEPDREDDYEED